MLLCSVAMVAVAFSSRAFKSGKIVSASTNCLEKESKTSESTHSCSFVTLLIFAAASILEHKKRSHIVRILCTEVHQTRKLTSSLPTS
ncbi:hypothetical protein PR003_g2772 [Phytophthora rubi]|uniref:RxLR effector protein n=1 Tax=Phytophthora rubi TaxID=129364 RepID=A0A6A4G0B1_9STRA|nr:hypothetical protein PR003_g2772 [Phytophthora rubi]